VARHVRRGEPRAHWVLLGLTTVVLLAELCLGGVVRQVGHDGAPGTGPAGGGAAPAAITGAGPVLSLGPDGEVTSRSVPRRTLALTFDDGPDPQWTPRVLDILARHGAHATFFVIGAKVNDHPELVRRILAEGHEIGVHTFTHVDLAAQPRWRRDLELALTRNAVAAATGRTATLMRPPFSSTPVAVTTAGHAALRDAARAGYLIVLADHDPKDWRRPGAAAIVRAATPAADRGGVVLLHDGGGDRSQTVVAVDTLLSRLDAKGYRFTTVSAALGLPPPADASTAATVRGTALRWAQATSGVLTTGMGVLLGVAIGMSLLRLAVQLVTSRRHVRRTRGRGRRRLRYQGPLTVVVPAYNEAANIAATVRSLAANDYPDLDIIVVDDGSTDDTAGIVRRLRLPRVRVLRQRNAGKPAALNLGIAHARGDLLVLVDGDTVFEPQAVGRLVQPFAEPDVGAVSGNTKVANRRGLLGRWQHLEYVMGFNLDRRMFDVAGCMTTVPGAIGAFRRTALADVGGVPAVTLAEDTDLTMAVVRAGWRVVYAEDAVAWTEVPGSLRQLWRQRYRWCYGTMQAMWKHRRAVLARGPAGRLGRRGLTYLFLWQVLLPLAAPAVDVYAVYGLFFLPLWQVATVWWGFVAVQAATAAYALRLDGERLRPLWTLPLQQLVYRQLMYLVVVQSTVTALVGVRLPWQRLIRTGQAAPPVRPRRGPVTRTPTPTL
jgi:cellulose synthase/poly-beta-1,6-N-acetylglucosamine synthase-like glycosyltransferase/peptidoglycan/xylan/chitin deacetylase (PgdA/CDA1 family)